MSIKKITKDLNCPLCGNIAKNNFYGLRDYFYCKNCSIARIKKISKATYDETYYKGSSGIANKLFSPIMNFFYSIRSGYIKKKKVKLWIDIGAGDGEYLKTVSSEKKIGVEISQAGRNIMNNFSINTLTEKKFLKINNLNADVISFWHVLEHVENPQDYLSSAHRNLRNNGEIIVGIPNIDSFEFKTFKSYWFHLVPKFHIWFFTPISFEKILLQAGFRVKYIDYWSPEHHLSGILQSFINKTAKSDSLLHRLIRRRLNHSKINFKDIFWSFFWITIGSPIVISFWIISAVFQKSGTVVIVATP